MAPLNGAYYGPSIPPPSKSYHRPGRGGCGCCGLCSCCCGCIFNCIFSCICQILITIAVIIGVAAFLFWLIVRPSVVKFHVTDASLTQFNYTNNTLRYNLAVNITVRNPNKRLGIYYDYIEARALYQNLRFDSQTLDPFYQGHKNTSFLNTVFKGQHLIPLGSDQISELTKEKGDGVYGIDLKLYMRVRFKFGLFKIGKMKPKVSCDLKVPFKTGNGTSSGHGFETTKCHWDY